MIEVRLFATFREGRDKIKFYEPCEFADVKGLIKMLSIPEAEVAILLINGRHSKIDSHISDGDVIALFPPVGGG